MVVLVGWTIAPIPAAHAQAHETSRAGAQAPVAVAVADTLTMTPWSSGEEVHVLANDSDPDGGNLQICRLEAPDDSGLGVHIWSEQGFFEGGPVPSGSTYLLLEPQRKLKPGILTITYYACDRELLTPATLTVNVVHITAEKVAGRRGVVRFTNPLDYAVDILYAAPHSERLDGVIRVKPHAAKERKLKHATTVWYAWPHVIEGDGDDPLPIDGGVVRHIGAKDTGARDSGAMESPTPQHSRLDPPADAAPVTTDDQIALDYYDSADVRVLANDSDGSAGELAVCWVDVPADSGLDAVIEPWYAAPDRARSDSPDRYISLGANAATPGTYQLTYYACDKRQMTPGTLTVTVREFPPPTVRRVRDRPGTLAFTNLGYRTVTIQYFESHHYSEKYRLKIRPGATRRLHVAYDDLSYFADTKIGPLSSGRVRNLYPRG
jgi:hypothetical protein